MASISTSKIVVLVNGSKTNFFNLTREIRQGDHLSPYIFILCMKLLSIYISHQVDPILWDPIKLNHSSPPLSHLLFVDGLTLIVKANVKSIRTIHHCLFFFVNFRDKKLITPNLK